MHKIYVLTDMNLTGVNKIRGVVWTAYVNKKVERCSWNFLRSWKQFLRRLLFYLHLRSKSQLNPRPYKYVSFTRQWKFTLKKTRNTKNMSVHMYIFNLQDQTVCQLLLRRLRWPTVLVAKIKGSWSTTKFSWMLNRTIATEHLRTDKDEDWTAVKLVFASN